MLKRTLSFVLTLALLLTGLTIPVQAGGLTKPERYEAALEELKNFLNDMGSMSLNDLSAMFDNLGAYQMSMPLTYYTMVLSSIENGSYDQVFYLTDILKQNAKFCEFLEEDGELGTLEDLELYAQGRRAEMNGELTKAVEYYQQCMWYRDSMDRVIDLQQSMLEAKYQEALSWYKRGTYEGYQRAYELFLPLGDYKDTQAYLQKANVLRVTPTPRPSPTPTAAPTAAPTPVGEVFYGTGEGLEGNIVVAVTMDNERIIAIQVLSHKETVGERALQQLSERMISLQTIDVDVVTGATHTSQGLIEAVADAVHGSPYAINMTASEYYEVAERAYAKGNMRDAFYNYLRAGDYSDARTKAMKCGDACIAVSSNSALFLTEDGTVFFAGNHVFGYDMSGLKSWEDIVAIVSIANDCYYGLKEDGTVLFVGDYGYDVSDWRDIIAIDTGSLQIVGLKKDGTVVAAGEPDECCNVGDWKNVLDIKAGFWHSAAVTNTGEILYTGNGQDGLDAVKNWRNPAHLSMGTEHAVIIQANGELQVIGNHQEGLCNGDEWKDIVHVVATSQSSTIGLRGNGTVVIENVRYPVNEVYVSTWRNVVAVDGTNSAIYAITSDGRIYTSGGSSKGLDHVRLFKR